MSGLEDWLSVARGADADELRERILTGFKAGKPLTDLQLAKLLRPFKVKPKLVRDGEDRFRGYEEHAFRDAFARYVGSDP